MKVVAYSGTRNTYDRMIPAINSLLINGNIDKIYLLIEDNSFPYILPSKVECINISRQLWFKKETCANWYEGWGGYMVLIRSVYSKIFSNLDKILSLDIDTIVTEDISDLWNIDLSNYYLAGVRDTPELNKNGLYVNGGVLLQNLTKIRENGMDDKMIFYINHFKKEYAEQDLLNQVYRNNILELPTEYNSNPAFMNFNPNKRIIYHYAGIRTYMNEPIVQYYNNIKLESI